METKLDTKRVENIKRKIGFEGCLTTNAIGSREGLGSLWRREGMAETYNYSQWRISAWVKDEI